MKCQLPQNNPFVPVSGKCRLCTQDAAVEGLCKEDYCTLIEQKVKETIDRFSMFTPRDKILVAYSGGKDSTVLLYILNKLGYAVDAITINAYIGCYSRENVVNAIAFTKSQKIPLHHVSFREEFGYSLCYLRTLLKQQGVNLKSCTICGVLRRYLLNKHARQLGATKLAFGHNLDDEAQVILMNLLKGQIDPLLRIGPVNGLVSDARFVRRIKPLYFVAEQEIIWYSKIKEFPVHYGACPCSVDSYRYFIREIIKRYASSYPSAKRNIVELFLHIAPSLREQSSNTALLLTCLHCGEPAARQFCQACSLLMSVAQA